MGGKKNQKLKIGFDGRVKFSGHDFIAGCIRMDGVVHQFFIAHEPSKNIWDQKCSGLCSQFFILIFIAPVPEKKLDAPDHN